MRFTMIRGAVVIVVSSIAAPAYSDPTCNELSSVAYAVAVARDQGTKHQRARQLVSEDLNFSAEEKRILLQMTDQIYSLSLSPDVTVAIAKDACRRSMMKAR